jgi:Arc-like DNA binding domain
MARKTKRRESQAQIKIRVPADLRDEIQADAEQAGHSMNDEIVRRLRLFAQSPDATQLAARAIVQGLDATIVHHIVAQAAPARYRELAAQLLRLASAASGEENRKSFRKLAQSWTELAKKAESQTEEAESIFEDTLQPAAQRQRLDALSARLAVFAPAFVGTGASTAPTAI